jgi:crotonobetainyl-CoA:carnitine CoA-transferase CaiB-like acyl-CoA transferase
MITGSDGGRMLEGVRVVDLTSVVFGPYATKILADMGADVIKVEPPEGDTARYLGKPAETLGMAPTFMAISRGKKSLSMDLKQPESQAKLRALIADADVLIHNIRGKAAETLGIDYETVRAIKPDIVHVHCTGFGQDGPYAELQAYDDVIQAASGTATLLSRVDGNPRPRYLPSLIADKVSGLHAAYAMLGAIIHKLRTGEGQTVEVPMFESFANFMLLEHLAGLTFDPPNAPACYFRQIDPDRQPFQTKDGWISIVPYTFDMMPRVFAVLEDPAFLGTDAVTGCEDLVERNGIILRRIAQLTPNFTTAELLTRCANSRIPAQAVRDIADILEDPHLAATGFFERRVNPTEGSWIAMKAPVKFGVAFQSADGEPPPLGADNA